MAARAMKVLIDTDVLKRDMKQLTAALERGGDRVSHDQAIRTMAKVANATPYRTGALFHSVTVAQVQGGWGVTYGGGLPYAGYIEKRQHPVRKGARGSRTEFRRALEELAATETSRI